MNDYPPRWIIWVRALLGYLCLLAVFSSFLICVHLSLQEKRLRYVMANLLSEKTRLLRDVSLAHAQVDSLRRLERLEEICEKQLIPLASPGFPALILPENSIREASRKSVTPDNDREDPLNAKDLRSIAYASKEKVID